MSDCEATWEFDSDTVSEGQVLLTNIDFGATDTFTEGGDPVGEVDSGLTGAVTPSTRRAVEFCLNVQLVYCCRSCYLSPKGTVGLKTVLKRYVRCSRRLHKLLKFPLCMNPRGKQLPTAVQAVICCWRALSVSNVCCRGLPMLSKFLQAAEGMPVSGTLENEFLEIGMCALPQEGPCPKLSERPSFQLKVGLVASLKPLVPADTDDEQKYRSKTTIPEGPSASGSAPACTNLAVDKLFPAGGIAIVRGLLISYRGKKPCIGLLRRFIGCRRAWLCHHPL